MKLIVIGKADPNETVEDLRKRNSKIAGDYMAIRTGNILQIVEERTVTPPTKKEKK